MTNDSEALIAAIRAEEKAQGAHRRLDRMNGSIDRLADNINTTKGDLGAKLDTLFIQQATQVGIQEKSNLLIDSHRFVITVFVSLSLGLLGTIAAFAAVLLH